MHWQVYSIKAERGRPVVEHLGEVRDEFLFRAMEAGAALAGLMEVPDTTQLLLVDEEDGVFPFTVAEAAQKAATNLSHARG